MKKKNELLSSICVLAKHESQFVLYTVIGTTMPVHSVNYFYELCFFLSSVSIYFPRDHFTHFPFHLPSFLLQFFLDPIPNTIESRYIRFMTFPRAALHFLSFFADRNSRWRHLWVRKRRDVGAAFDLIELSFELNLVLSSCAGLFRYKLENENLIDAFQ